MARGTSGRSTRQYSPMKGQPQAQPSSSARATAARIVHKNTFMRRPPAASARCPQMVSHRYRCRAPVRQISALCRTGPSWLRRAARWGPPLQARCRSAGQPPAETGHGREQDHFNKDRAGPVLRRFEPRGLIAQLPICAALTSSSSIASLRFHSSSQRAGRPLIHMPHAHG